MSYYCSFLNAKFYGNFAQPWEFSKCIHYFFRTLGSYSFQNTPLELRKYLSFLSSNELLNWINQVTFSKKHFLLSESVWFVEDRNFVTSEFICVFQSPHHCLLFPKSRHKSISLYVKVANQIYIGSKPKILVIHKLSEKWTRQLTSVHTMCRFFQKPPMHRRLVPAASATV